MARYRDPFLQEDDEMYNRQPKTSEELLAERMEEIRREVAATKGVGPIADGSTYASNLEEAKPRQVKRTPKLSNLEGETLSKASAPIDPVVLKELAKNEPSLIEQYKKRMGLADEKVNDARDVKDMVGYAGVAGRFLEDMANSRKEDVILHNRMSELGKAPQIRQEERYKYDQSGLDGMVADKDKTARADRDREEGQFFTEHKLKGMQEADDLKAALKDPNSQESQSARANLKMVMPDIEKKIPNFNNLTAEQAERAAPSIMAKWKADREDARHRESLAAQLAKASGKQATPKESQSKAAGFGRRIEQAEAEFKDIAKSGYDRTDLTSAIGASGAYPNLLRGDNALRQEQAERNFINAVLRRESGAAISQGEFDSAEKQYFPRVGDGPETLRQKERNRRQVLESLKAEAGPAWDQTPSVGGGNSRNEVKRKTKDGRVAIYDADTKDFIRYED